MKYYLFLLLLAVTAFSLSLNGQESQTSTATKFDPNKLIYGADIGFSFSQNYWTIGGAPQIGYKFTDRVHLGAGLGYRYGKSDRKYFTFANGQDFTYHYTESSISFNLFAHYYPWKKLILSIKPEIMNTHYKETAGDEEYSLNKFVPAVTIGGGVHLKPVILQLNYELIQNKYSPYNDGLFFSIGFLL